LTPGWRSVAIIALAIHAAAIAPEANLVHLRLDGWSATIDPDTLTISALLDGDSREILIASGEPHPTAGLAQTGSSAHWRIPDLGMTVSFTARANRLHVRFDPSRESTLQWPRTGEDPRMSALILPDGEGLYLPLDDQTWSRRLAGDPCYAAQSRLSMPFWSYEIERRTITFLALSDIRTEVCLGDERGRIAATAKHAFLQRDKGAPYELEIWPGGGSPIAPALEYRDWLIHNGQFVSLADKIRRNPEVAKLFGALHMYVFGDGRTLEFLDDLRSLGVQKAWIGYDQDQRMDHYLIGDRYIAAAKTAGYLIGPYDTFTNAQNPAKADTPDAIWGGGLYTAGCIVDSRGRIVRGFAGRGCELSSEALQRAESGAKNIAGHVDERLRDGANSYFLDVDAYGELFDDYSPSHPMTQFQDRTNRLKRMKDLRDRGLVLGSEEGASWSVPVIDFAHGALSLQNLVLWQRRKDFGPWWPPERPRVFFQPVKLDDEFRAAKYDPLYRIPLYEAAFHGSVISTDRWDVPLPKIPDLVPVRELLELLYGVPSIWAMDRRQLHDSGGLLAKLLPFFAPLHSRIATLPLTSFEWLAPDRKVQRTKFADELTLTANFDKQSFGAIPPGCIQARWIASGRDELFCPDAAPTAARGAR
jgi:hypothetical protein